MCRKARIKSEDAYYHIIMKGMSEIKLFRCAKNKDRYLFYLKKYKDIYGFKVLAYCLMNTHVHLLIDTNGADISDYMHDINQCYAQYYNRTYKRNGHVFGDRFKSILPNEEFGLLQMSSYIHNNPKDIKGFRTSVENYEYSSFGIYAGKYKNRYNLIDPALLLGYFLEKNNFETARKDYYKFVKIRLSNKVEETAIVTEITGDNINEFKYINNIFWQNEKRIPRIKQTICPSSIISFLCKTVTIEHHNLLNKSSRKYSDYRSLCVFLLRAVCNLKFNEINSIMGNLTASALSKLCNKGYDLIMNNPNYMDIFSKLKSNPSATLA